MITTDIIDQIKKQAEKEKENNYFDTIYTQITTSANGNIVSVETNDNAFSNKINHEEIKKLIDIEELIFLINEAIKYQKYELAAHFVDRKRFLLSDEGQKFIEREKARIKAEQREEKLNRILNI